MQNSVRGNFKNFRAAKGEPLLCLFRVRLNAFQVSRE